MILGYLLFAACPHISPLSSRPSYKEPRGWRIAAAAHWLWPAVCGECDEQGERHG
jgi:hypothetical protein